MVRGTLWAWITAVVLVAFSLLFGALALLAAFTENGFPFLGLAMFGLPAGVLLGLVVPRSVRGFFTSRTAPAPYPTFPGQRPWTP